MKKVFKNLVAVGIVTGLSISSSLIVFGGDNTGWRQTATGWYYQDESGFIQNQWKEINGAWYYFNQDGYMLTGWQNLGGAWYYLNSSGVMHTGWLQLGNDWYYMDEHGVMVTGDRRIAGKDYYFNADGLMEVEEEDWKEAYRQYLIENKSKYSSDNSFGLIDMDGDGIDELFICFNNCWISESLTYQNGQVKQIEWEDAGHKDTFGWSRWTIDGVVVIENGHMMDGFKHFFKYDHGMFKEINSLYYEREEINSNGELRTIYMIGDSECSETQWNNKIEEYINSENGLDWQDFMYSYTSSNINSILGD